MAQKKAEESSERMLHEGMMQEHGTLVAHGGCIAQLMLCWVSSSRSFSKYGRAFLLIASESHP